MSPGRNGRRQSLSPSRRSNVNGNEVLWNPHCPRRLPSGKVFGELMAMLQAAGVVQSAIRGLAPSPRPSPWRVRQFGQGGHKVLPLAVLPSPDCLVTEHGTIE
jgi:hypothetical protein